MKLKEKLAEEYRVSVKENDYLAIKDAFLAGFEKAKEVAEDKANEATVFIDDKIDKKLVWLDAQYNVACYEIAATIRKIGEEEVE